MLTLSPVKQKISEHFDALAPSRHFWRNRNSYYYKQQERYLRFLIPEGKNVLEIGCGAGDLLASLKPVRGVGIDLSRSMIETARTQYPYLEFCHADAEDNATWQFCGTFDYIVISDTVGLLEDVQKALEQLAPYCAQSTRLVIVYYNFMWEPVLKLAERLGLKMPQFDQNWLSPADIENLLQLTDFEVVKKESRLLFPKRFPGLNFIFEFIGAFPLVNKLCISHFLVARPFVREAKIVEKSVSVVIPCRNERGNIEPAVSRLPRMGLHTEIIFVDGHSRDGTQDEIKRVMAAYPEWDITFLIQDGKGKGDAVRKGFSHSKNDILMILDADLTVPPEDLPKFYQAIVSGKGEFINGSRLVYPMDNQAMRLLNLFGNKFFSMAFSWLLNQRIKDTLCGTKVLTREDYERIVASRSYFGDFDPFGDFDLLFGAAKQNLRIIDLPIRYRARSYGETQISRFQHGWLLLRMVVFAFKKLKGLFSEA